MACKTDAGFFIPHILAIFLFLFYSIVPLMTLLLYRFIAQYFDLTAFRVGVEFAKSLTFESSQALNAARVLFINGKQVYTFKSVHAFIYGPSF